MPLRPTLKLFWFAFCQPTHHFYPDTIIVLGFFFFFIHLFVNSLALVFLLNREQKIPYQPTHHKNQQTNIFLRLDLL